MCFKCGAHGPVLVTISDYDDLVLFGVCARVELPCLRPVSVFTGKNTNNGAPDTTSRVRDPLDQKYTSSPPLDWRYTCVLVKKKKVKSVMYRITWNTWGDHSLSRTLVVGFDHHRQPDGYTQKPEKIR